MGGPAGGPRAGTGTGRACRRPARAATASSGAQPISGQLEPEAAQVQPAALAAQAAHPPRHQQNAVVAVEEDEREARPRPPGPAGHHALARPSRFSAARNSSSSAWTRADRKPPWLKRPPGPRSGAGSSPVRPRQLKGHEVEVARPQFLQERRRLERGDLEPDARPLQVGREPAELDVEGSSGGPGVAARSSRRANVAALAYPVAVLVQPARLGQRARGQLGIERGRRRAGRRARRSARPAPGGPPRSGRPGSTAETAPCGRRDRPDAACGG